LIQKVKKYLLWTKRCIRSLIQKS